MCRQVIRNDDHDQAKWDISVFLEIPYQCQYEAMICNNSSNMHDHISSNAFNIQRVNKSVS